jgi:oligopeptide transport system substrate-binding protein
MYAAAGFTTVHPLRVRLLIPTDDTLRKVALAVAAMWHESLGVETALIDREYRAFLATRDDRTQWDVVSHGWNADYQDPGNFLDIFTASGPQNDAGLADPEFDRLMTGAAATADASRRTEQLGQAERRLLDIYAVAPLYFPVSRRLVKPRVRGAILGPMNHNYSKYLRVAAP